MAPEYMLFSKSLSLFNEPKDMFRLLDVSDILSIIHEAILRIYLSGESDLFPSDSSCSILL